MRKIFISLCLCVTLSISATDKAQESAVEYSAAQVHSPAYTELLETPPSYSQSIAGTTDDFSVVDSHSLPSQLPPQQSRPAVELMPATELISQQPTAEKCCNADCTKKTVATIATCGLNKCVDCDSFKQCFGDACNNLGSWCSSKFTSCCECSKNTCSSCGNCASECRQNTLKTIFSKKVVKAVECPIATVACGIPIGAFAGICCSLSLFSEIENLCIIPCWAIAAGFIIPATSIAGICCTAVYFIDKSLVEDTMPREFMDLMFNHGYDTDGTCYCCGDPQ